MTSLFLRLKTYLEGQTGEDERMALTALEVFGERLEVFMEGDGDFSGLDYQNAKGVDADSLDADPRVHEKLAQVIQNWLAAA